MTDGYKVTPQDLISHAGDLRGFAENVRQAKGAAIDPAAFGFIGGVWGVAMNCWSDDAGKFADEAAKAADNVANQLLAMAATYEEEEQTAAANLRSAGEDTP